MGVAYSKLMLAGSSTLSDSSTSKSVTCSHCKLSHKSLNAAVFIWRLAVLHIFKVVLARYATSGHRELRAYIQRVLEPIVNNFILRQLCLAHIISCFFDAAASRQALNYPFYAQSTH